MDYKDAKEQLKLLRIGEEYSSDPDSIYAIDALDEAIELLGLAEQKRLVKLPCKTGATIYQLRGKRHIKGEGISPRTVGYVIIKGNGKYELNHQGMTPCRESELEKTWFLTKEEAEARLAELEEE